MFDRKPRTVFEMEKGDEPVTFNGTSMEETNMDVEERNRNRNEVFEKVKVNQEQAHHRQKITYEKRKLKGVKVFELAIELK